MLSDVRSGCENYLDLPFVKGSKDVLMWAVPYVPLALSHDSVLFFTPIGLLLLFNIMVESGFRDILMSVKTVRSGCFRFIDMHLQLSDH